ncbi:M50 family metallopeptidase [Candidatus Proelusimicrobium volucris]|uniref:M50 family metallopeptidase n=1 Tax=Candidatus Proelusimicrobium volucris TaxID=3416225 RepID=UPI003D0E2FBD
MNRIAKLFLGVVLLPLAFSILLSVFEVLWYIVKGYKVTLYFMLGAALYVLTHLFFYNFSRFYVMAHEFSHAAAAWLCGYTVSGLSVKSDSGEVKVSGINTFVLLAPYCVPLYSLIVTFVYLLLNLFVDGAERYGGLFLALFGFCTALHLMHTYKALTETEQSDISRAGGGVFSFSLIVLINMAIILGLAEIYFPSIIPIGSLSGGIIRRTIQFWKWFFDNLYSFSVKFFAGTGEA